MTHIHDSIRRRRARKTVSELSLERENTRLRTALQKVADLVDSEVGEPLDDAIDIANKALGNTNG